jgi:hypothetical protein
VAARFGRLTESEQSSIASGIHEANVVTACQFCNSTTSRDRAPFTMEEIIADLPADPEDALRALALKLQEILDAKRAQSGVEASVGLSRLSTHYPPSSIRAPTARARPPESS